MKTASSPKTRWTVVGAIALALSSITYAAIADDGAPAGDEAVYEFEQPMPVEPDGGIGDTPLPVEPDGGIGDTPLPVEPDGGIGDTPLPMEPAG